MLGGSHQRVVGGVDVHIVVIEYVARHAGALEHMNMLAVIGNSRHVVKILRLGFAILVFDGIGNHHRGARGGEMYARATELQVVFRVLSV